jgi:hypothetical protein
MVEDQFIAECCPRVGSLGPDPVRTRGPAHAEGALDGGDEAPDW